MCQSNLQWRIIRYKFTAASACSAVIRRELVSNYVDDIVAINVSMDDLESYLVKCFFFLSIISAIFSTLLFV